MFEYIAQLQVKGSPVLRVNAMRDARKVGELWCFTNEADDGKRPGFWYFKTEDGTLYGYRVGSLAYRQAQMVIEDHETAKDAPC